MSDWKRAESSTCTGEVGMPPEWLDVLVGATLPLIGLHRLPPEREAAREGCARVALARRLLGRPATALRSASPGHICAGDCGNLLLGVADVAWVVVCRAAGRVVPVLSRAVVIPPTSPAHMKRAARIGNKSNGPSQTSPEKKKSTQRVCGNPLPPLPAPRCVLVP